MKQINDVFTIKVKLNQNDICIKEHMISNRQYIVIFTKKKWMFTMIDMITISIFKFSRIDMLFLYF